MGLSIEGFDLGLELPNFSTQGIGTWITLAVAFILFLIVGGVAIYVVYNNLKFNKKIVVYENISGSGYQQTGTDRARLVKVGRSGEEILLLKRRKCYRSAYGKKMGRNTYWFAVGQDGYWYNVVLGDLDAKMGMLDIEPIDRDMRYMYVAIIKNIEERYRKQGFMEKYGPMIIQGIFTLIVIGAIWLLMSKAGDLIQAGKPTAEALAMASDKLSVAIANLDTICSGGSGIHPAG